MTRVTAASPTFSATATRVTQPSLSASAFGASTFPDEMTRVTATAPTFSATATRIARPSLSTGAFGVNPPAHPFGTEWGTTSQDYGATRLQFLRRRPGPTHAEYVSVCLPVPMHLILPYP